MRVTRMEVVFEALRLDELTNGVTVEGRRDQGWVLYDSNIMG